MSVDPNASIAAGSLRSLIAVHPVAAFLVIAIPLAWLAQCLAILLLGDVTPGLLVELLVLLGAALLVTAAAEGGPGVRRLFSGAVRWRVGAGWYAAPWTDVALSWGVLIGFALVVRYLMGLVYVGTGGSIRILGLLHGSMNAAGGLDAADWWQYIPAVVVLTAAVAAYLAVRSRTTGQGSGGHALRRRIRPVRPASP
ncbi:MAG TPA: hypothetical protein VIM40_08900 [Arthrobacter sp.]|jgi:hypothetical protein